MWPPGTELRLSVLGAKPLSTEPSSCPVSVFCFVLFYFVFMATDFFYLVLSLIQLDFIHRAWQQQGSKRPLKIEEYFLPFSLCISWSRAQQRRVLRLWQEGTRCFVSPSTLNSRPWGSFKDMTALHPAFSTQLLWGQTTHFSFAFTGYAGFFFLITIP